MYSATALLLLVTSLVISVSSAPVQERQDAAPTVTLSSGVLVGTTSQYPGATATNNKFLGIPYAKSPPLRFGMPEAAEPWNSTLEATSYRPACIQQPFGSSPTPNGESEDCLYANVYTPEGTTPDSSKAVMVWIYGGNLQSGDSSIPEFDGSSYASNQDVIVVTFNYRTNVFGFSNSPELPVEEQNVGFYDQRLLLEWVQSNIAAFGGDASRVTLFGQSAGAYSIRYLMAFPPQDPLPFHAAIMESQATSIAGNGSLSWNTLATRLGCTGPNVLSCMRAADPFEIKRIVVNRTENILGFPPVNDGVTFLSDANFQFVSKKSAPVPMLIGSNGQEASVVPYLLGLNGDSLIELASNLSEILPGLGGTLVDIFEKVLPNNAVSDLTTTLLTSLVFQCPAAELAKISQANGQPTWRYFYNASIPNIEATAGFPNARAFHGAEFPMVFGAYPRTDATPFQEELSAYMQTNWANFAKDPSTGPAWPEYGFNQSVANLGGNGAISTTIPAASTIDLLCPLLDPVVDVIKLMSLTNAGTPPALAALEQMLQL